jgi:hypothetical protein
LISLSFFAQSGHIDAFRSIVGETRLGNRGEPGCESRYPKLPRECPPLLVGSAQICPAWRPLGDHTNKGGIVSKGTLPGIVLGPNTRRWTDTTHPCSLVLP